MTIRREQLDDLKGKRVLVLGDLILDRYTWGSAERVSPEAPVLVLSADQHEVRLGGAGSVAGLLRGLGADVTLAGVVGDDAEGRVERRLLQDAGIHAELVPVDTSRPTTVKERFLGRVAQRHPHQLLRVDREVRDSVGTELESQLAAAVAERIADFQVLLVSDYAKGVCTPRLLTHTLAAARPRGISLIVDPARLSDYERYRGATMVVPNRTECELAVDRPIRTPTDALAAGRTLCSRWDIASAMIKLDADGIVVIDSLGQEARHVPTQRRAVCDVTGAGDMVLAVAGLCQAAGWTLRDTAKLANIAAGLEVERLGVAGVSWEEICAELPGGVSKVVTLDQLLPRIEAYRRQGQRIVFTNGCFDLLHVGHVAYLQEAARHGDVLVVAINSDRTVRTLKGPGRPVVPAGQRATLLAALAVVDHVLVFDEATPHRLLERIRPQILVKGGTYTPEQVVGREIVQQYGGKVCVTGKVEDVSTTRILASVRGYVPPTFASVECPQQSLS